MRTGNHQQHGLSSFATIGAFVGLGTILLILFFVAGSGVKKSPTTPTTKTNTPAPANTQTNASKEPPFIRIPENSNIYNNSTYKFMFAYPDSFGTLAEVTNAIDANNPTVFNAESALAAKKPIGNGSTVLDGKFGIYVAKKADFKIIVAGFDVAVAPTKTGDDTTWKVVSRGSDNKDYSIGSAYQVKTVKSQTGIVVYDFGVGSGTTNLLARWVFESGDNYVVILLPSLSKTDNTVLTAADTAAYKVISNNIARTIRIPPNSGTTSTTSSSDNLTTTKSPASNPGAATSTTTN